MNLELYKPDGTLAGKTKRLSKKVFGIEPNNHAIYQDVRAYMTNRRQGTAATKTRAAARGGGRKPWRQKGRGTARAGTNRSPLWVGGGVTFGPSPHDYSIRLPKKIKRLARRSALTVKAREDAIRLVESFSIESGKTKDMYNILKGLELDSKKTLMLIPEVDSQTVQACRNIPNLQVRIAENVSTYDILNCSTLLIQENALAKLEGSLAA
jgi:large subunit ribosomal protein L4